MMPWRQPAARMVAALPDGLRWRARNAIALARWIGGASEGGAGYTDGFWDFHAGGDWIGFARAILDVCAPRSVVDVGCGDGKLLAALREQARHMPLLGIDGSAAALRRAARSAAPVEHHDLSSIRARDRRALRSRVAEFDVAVSLETAEHLPPWCAPSFIQALASARLVVFSAAHPGQGGTLHMNERPPAYWRVRFEGCGLVPAACDGTLRDAVARLDLPWWYAANIQVFERTR